MLITRFLFTFKFCTTCLEKDILGSGMDLITILINCRVHEEKRQL